MTSAHQGGLRRTRAEDFLIATKVMVPTPRPEWVDRPALVDSLDPGPGVRLCLVSGPPGSGKTTLLGQWAKAASDRRVAWLTLDAGDDDPARFWLYVLSALRTIEPSFGRTLFARLRVPGVSVADEVLPALTNALVDLAPATLVVDDYHLITSDEVHEGLHYVVERLPPGVCVIVATQVDPPIPLARLRARAELTEVRELAFSADESSELLQRSLGVELGAADVAAVHARTEGWAAGLHLVSLSARTRQDPVPFLNELPADTRHLVDYLWEEVLDRQTDELRSFLVQSSILERLCAPLCQAVTQRNDADELIAELERANLFLVPLDQSRRWYRYHQLFREVLARELAESGPEFVADLHRRASAWHADHGSLVEAIEHAIVAGDVHFAADEVARHWVAIYNEGHAYDLQRWLDRLPRKVVEENASLCLSRAGLSRSLGRLDDVEPWLDAAERSDHVGEIPGHAGSVAGGVAIQRAMYLLDRGDVAGALRQARAAVELEGRDPGVGLTVARFFLGVTLFFANEAHEARPLLEGFLHDERLADQHARAFAALAYLAYVALDAREGEKASALASQALERAETHGLGEYPQASLAHGALGASLLYDGDVDAAEEHLERAVTLARRGRDACDIGLALLQLARLRLSQDDREAAGDALVTVRSELDGSVFPVLTTLVDEVEHGLGARAAEQGQDRPLEELTRAELRVLRLFPLDLTYREMAGQLYVSPNTLKTHSLHIRRKLHASSRSEAVSRARTLGLL